MTYQPPFGSSQPHRAPQHAAPLGLKSPLRQHIRRALRLVMAAGTGGAGLCLVVGAVALVASVTEPAVATHAAATPRPYAAGQYSLGGASARAAPGRRGILVFTGHGSGNTGQFMIGSTGTWRLDWSYSCKAFGQQAGFIVGEDGTGTVGGIRLDEVGASGHGAASAHEDAGTHYLAVTSECTWMIKVVK